MTTMMTLPQPGLKAKDLDRNFFPNRQVVKAYQEVGQEYELGSRDRTWNWFYSQVTGKESIRNQPIEQTIQQMMRQKDKDGEWLTFQMGLAGRNWKGNKVEYWYDQGGKIEGYPEFFKEINPETDEVIAGTTQIEELKTIFTLPFTKQKFDELSKFTTERTGYTIKSRGMGGRRYTCSLEEFKEMPFEELESLKTGFTDYVKWKGNNNRPGGAIDK